MLFLQFLSGLIICHINSADHLLLFQSFIDGSNFLIIVILECLIANSVHWGLLFIIDHLMLILFLMDVYHCFKWSLSSIWFATFLFSLWFLILIPFLSSIFLLLLLLFLALSFHVLEFFHFLFFLLFDDINLLLSLSCFRLLVFMNIFKYFTCNPLVFGIVL